MGIKAAGGLSVEKAGNRKKTGAGKNLAPVFLFI
jgi:hypothetical protein